MAILFIPVGIPGCGKSTWSEGIRAVAVSSDVIRTELCGDVNDQTRNTEVFDVFHKSIKNFLHGNLDVFADATNLDERSRWTLRKIARETGAYTHLIGFRNLDQAIQRNVIRDRVVPDHVMARMIEKYERAMLAIPNETYNRVTEVTATR